MMCPKCQKEIFSSESSCPHCGSPLPSTAKQTSQTLIEAGRELEGKKEWEQALAKWESALAISLSQDEKYWLIKKIKETKEQIMSHHLNVAPQMDFGDPDLVGKSEMDVERELIELIERGNQHEKQGKYQEAIETLEKAMEIAQYKGALQKKLDRLRKKMNQDNQQEEEAPAPDESENPQDNLDDLDALDRELMDLSDELHQEVGPSPTPMPTPMPSPMPSPTPQPDNRTLEEVFGLTGPMTPKASEPKEAGLGDLFGTEEAGTKSPVAPTMEDLFGTEEAVAESPVAGAIDDLFGTESPVAESPVAGAIDDLFGTEAPMTESPVAGKDDLGELFGDEKTPVSAPVAGGADLGDLFGEKAQSSSDDELEALLDSSPSAPEVAPPIVPIATAPVEEEKKKMATQQLVLSDILGDEVTPTASPDPPASPIASPMATPPTAPPTTSPAIAGDFPSPVISSDQTKGSLAVLIMFFFSVLFLGGTGFLGWKIWQQKQVFERGKEALVKKQYSHAITLLKKSQQPPFNFLVEDKIVKALLARAKSREKMVRGPLDRYWSQAEAHQQKGQWENEALLLPKILDISPNPTKVEKRRREIQKFCREKVVKLMGEKKWAEAEKLAGKALEFFPNSPLIENLPSQIRQKKTLAHLKYLIKNNRWKEARIAVENHRKKFFTDWKIHQFYRRKKRELKRKLFNNKRDSAQAKKIFSILREFISSPKELEKVKKQWQQ